MTTIAIINSCQADACINLVQSIIESDPLLPLEFVIVDNGSKDGSVQKISRHLPFAQIFSLKEEKSAGYAANYVFQINTNEQILFLDPAIIISEKGTVSNLIDCAKQDEEVGFYGVKIYAENANNLPIAPFYFPRMVDGWNNLWMNKTQVKFSSTKENTCISSFFVLVKTGTIKNKTEFFDDALMWSKNDRIWLQKIMDQGIKLKCHDQLVVTYRKNEKKQNEGIQYLKDLIEEWMFVAKTFSLLPRNLYFLFALTAYFKEKITESYFLNQKKTPTIDQLQRRLHLKLWRMAWKKYGRRIVNHSREFKLNPIRLEELEGEMFKALLS